VVKDHYKQIQKLPSSAEPETSSSGSIDPAALAPNQNVPKRHDAPIIPHDVNLTPESGQEEIKTVMEGESLRQLEESHLIAPKKLGRKRKPKVAVEQS
jgi:hypothetical protein